MEKKKTMYEITDDLIELNKLMDDIVDENGEPREPTEAELETMRDWFKTSEAEFKEKFDNYCKFIKNLQIEASVATAEKDAHKKEMDRLSKRSKAMENRAATVKNLLWWSMDKLGLSKEGFKTSLFSAKEQNTKGSIVELTTYDYRKIPEEFLKQPELDRTAISQALKDGELIQKEGQENYGKIFFKNGEVLEGLSYIQGKALYIR
ncbi:siphovirus Gp157 family protein [Treponema denticola]|uniref:siphovirus Gp157 family protein n=1 Tax=Treponema denticola TaxID=158 RepID=UPI0011CB15AB|nr:siphovirus Gp157 family protein [Treponema denticola]